MAKRRTTPELNLQKELPQVLSTDFNLFYTECALRKSILVWRSGQLRNSIRDHRFSLVTYRHKPTNMVLHFSKAAAKEMLILLIC